MQNVHNYNVLRTQNDGPALPRQMSVTHANLLKIFKE